MPQSLIFDIKRYSINDGPGIRVTVFFKGCPLRCAWCHNPESQSAAVQKMYSLSKCIGCATCAEACPELALTLTSESGVSTDWGKCTLCGICASVCPTKAMEISGRNEPVKSIMKIINRETMLMDTSGGGVTFSGGEPLQHPELLTELLDACGREGIHRAVDTCGYANSKLLLRVAGRTDLFLYDIKHMNPEIHQKYTGISNELILDNLKMLAENGCEINIRIPLIVGFNADSENMEKTASFVAGLAGKPKKVSLLPYHSIASKKYEKLEQSFEPGIMEEPDKETINNCIAAFTSFGLTAGVGG
jgi:pyruvate formate lyase activating enzyme